MDCNTEKNEKGGKDLLLKICVEIEGATVAIGTADDPEAILKASHGGKVGDLVYFDTVPASVSEITAGTWYFVVEVPSTGSLKIAATPGGTAIIFTDTIADLDFELYQTLGGLRSKSLSFASEGVETTNHGSNQWREYADEAGIKTFSISGEGVFTSETNFRTLETRAIANQLTCLAFVEIKTGRIYAGCFKITSLEYSGDYNGESAYSMSAENSGEVDVFQAA